MRPILSETLGLEHTLTMSQAVEPGRVLLVDDEPYVLEGLRRQLRGGFDATIAVGGEAALEQLEREPAFDVIVSDMRMPGMDGATLLGKARERAPDTVRMLLTGQTDMDSAIAAINTGQIFRFLTKPCDPKTMLEALTAAVQQHRLITAEKQLLEETLRGSVQALLDTLALADPMAFSRAERIRKLVEDLLGVLDQGQPWEIGVAAMLSQIGSITLPPKTMEKLHRGAALDPDEHLLVDGLPRVAERLVAAIPRLEPVREIIRCQQRNFAGVQRAPGPTGTAIPLGARLLRVALDYDPLEAHGLPPQQAVATLRSRADLYDPAVLDGLGKLFGARNAAPAAREVKLGSLAPGMRLAADVRATSGQLLIGRGQLVTEAMMERLANFSRQGGIEEPLLVILNS